MSKSFGVLRSTRSRIQPPTRYAWKPFSCRRLITLLALMLMALSSKELKEFILDKVNQSFSASWPENSNAGSGIKLNIRVVKSKFKEATYV